MNRVLATYREVAKKAFDGWNDHDAFRLSAALSFYTVFSIGPILILATAFAGLIFGHDAAQGELSSQLRSLLGRAGADAVQALVADAQKKSTGILSTIVGLVILFIGASAVFAELKSSLNLIWDASPEKSRGVRGFVRTRLLSFAMVFIVGFLLLASLIASAVLAALGDFAPTYFVSLGIPFSLTTLLFAMMFKVLPDREIGWRYVWRGAVLTSLFFSVGKFFIGWYLGRSAIASTYGASASIVAVLMWAYYSSVIFFYGAEFTHAEAYSAGLLSTKVPAGNPLDADFRPPAHA